MRYRNLHGTNLQLSELGFGTWTLTAGKQACTGVCGRGGGHYKMLAPREIL